MTKPIVYIAGPMTGITHFNAEAFFEVAGYLQTWDYDVRNPAQHDIDTGFDPYQWEGTESVEVTGFILEDAMRWDLEQVRNADLVLVLPGWENSIGTKRELNEANNYGVKVIYLETLVGFHRSARLGENLKRIHDSGAASSLPCLLCFKEQADRMLKKKPLYPNAGFVQGKTITFIDESNPIAAPYSQGGYVSTMGIASKVALDQQQEAEAKVLAADPTTNTWMTAENQWTGDKGEVRTVSSTGGEKGTKLARYDLLPPDALRQVAEHYGKGAEKYDSNQWRKGYEWSKSFAALMRHAQQFWGGEDFDEETGSNHMAAVAWHALTLLTFYTDYPDFDDRYKGEADED